MLRMRDAQFYFMFLRIGRRGRHDIGQSSIAFNQLDISKIHLRRFHRQFNISSHNNDIVITGKIGLDGNNCRQLCRYKNLKGNGFFQAFTRGDGDFHLSLLLYSLIHRQCNLFEPLGFFGKRGKSFSFGNLPLQLRNIPLGLSGQSQQNIFPHAEFFALLVRLLIHILSLLLAI